MLLQLWCVLPYAGEQQSCYWLQFEESWLIQHVRLLLEYQALPVFHHQEAGGPQRGGVRPDVLVLVPRVQLGRRSERRRRRKHLPRAASTARIVAIAVKAGGGRRTDVRRLLRRGAAARRCSRSPRCPQTRRSRRPSERRHDVCPGGCESVCDLGRSGAAAVSLWEDDACK